MNSISPLTTHGSSRTALRGRAPPPPILLVEYPVSFKKMYVLPLYKGKRAISDPNSYRPISSVCTISKIFEHVLKFWVMKHVEEGERLDGNQHGFRTGRSCLTALVSFTQRVFSELDNPNQVVVVVFIDLKKAFDSVVHLSLLRKLKEIFDVPNNMLIVIGNYLFNRYYFIRIRKAMSRGFLVNRGIGQGLVFGPNLFVLFINDAGKILADCSYTLFADDLAINESSKNVVEAVSKMSYILCRFDNWCSVNGLTLNYANTKYMFIRKPQTKIPMIPRMFVREKELEYVSSFKYLEVHLDELFSFRDHFDHVSGKVSSHSGVIRKLRRYLSQQAFTTLVNAYIFSVIDYCLIVWGPSRVKDFDSLQSKVNQLLVIFFYLEAAKFYGKSYWNESHRENRGREAECRAFFSKLDYNSLLEKFNFLSVQEINLLWWMDSI
jgi:hypothetical protein